MDKEAPVRSDYDLAIQIACGEDEAVRALIRQHGPRVLGFLRRRFPSIADDAWQEALIRVTDKIGQYDPDKGGLGTWFLKLAHRCALSIVRAESKHNGQELEDSVTRDKRLDGGAPLTGKQRRHLERRAEQIREAVNALPPKERRVVVADLAFWKGPTLPDEVAPAEKLAISWGDTNANAIHQARCRARTKLREELTRRGIFTEDKKS